MMAERLTADFNREAYRPIIEDFWRLWFIGASNPGEGRELGNPSRMFTADPSLLPRWIELNEAEGRPSYMSVAIYSERNRPTAIDRLYYDLDSEDDLEAAWRDAQTLVSALRRRYGCEPILAFSGLKGYAVHAFLERPYRGPKLKEVYTELQAMTLRGLNLPTLDKAVVGDVKRLSRIPYTLHERSARLCLPIDVKGRPLLIDPSTLLSFREHGIPYEVVELAVSNIEEEKEDFQVRRFLQRRRGIPEKYGVRPCLQRVLEEEAEPAHLVRVALVAELRAEGYGPEAIIQLFSRFRDYDRRKTEYQVRDVIRRRIRPFRCASLQELGICLKDECFIYRKRCGR